MSDRDPVFTSKLWQELFTRARVSLHMSSAYHPQSDGQTERVNQCLETYLRCFVHTCPSKWIKWLSLAEYWYNTSFHSSLGSSSFEVLYGHQPNHFGLSSADVSVPADVSSWLKERSLMQAVARQHLLRAQQRMKKQADKSRSERQFAVGDLVYLKLQPYIQSSLSNRSSQKLSFKFFGPFTITDRIGSVAYRLALPSSSSVHPVFHVSQLKAAARQPPQVSPALPDDLTPFQVPARILQERLSFPGNSPVRQVLIQWSRLPRELATWEDEDHLRQLFPHAPAWGQAGCKEGGNVTRPAPANRTASADTNPEAEAQLPRRSTRPMKPNPRYAGGLK